MQLTIRDTISSNHNKDTANCFSLINCLKQANLDDLWYYQNLHVANSPLVIWYNAGFLDKEYAFFSCLINLQLGAKFKGK